MGTYNSVCPFSYIQTSVRKMLILFFEKYDGGTR